MLFKFSHRTVQVLVGIFLTTIFLLISFLSRTDKLVQTEPQITFPAQVQARISALTWGADSSNLIIGYSDGKLSIVPVDSDRSYFTVSDTLETVTSLASSPNNVLIGVGYEDGTVEIRRIRDGHLLFKAKNHADWIRSLSWHPESTLLASSSPDKTVVWDISTDEVLTSLEGDMVSLVWAQNSVLVGRPFNAQTYAWDVSTTQLLSSINAGVRVAVSLDGSKLAGVRGNHMMIWNLNDGAMLSDFGNVNGDINVLRWSPDNNHLAIAGGNLSNDYTVRIHDSLTGELELTLRGHTEPVFLLGWNPDKNYLISVSFDDTVRIWDITTGDILRILKIGEISDASKVLLSPDFSKIAVVTSDESIAIWALLPQG
ncbi:MAG: WD40 repeat domain-containing protein [Anaerolineaceae bacterium]|nr:WD40 repeat domain-containing protein [Anaerolineaceae bacterium]